MTTRHSLHWGLRPSTTLPGGGPGRRKSKPQTLSKARDSQTGTRSRQREADAPSARATASTSERGYLQSLHVLKSVRVPLLDLTVLPSGEEEVRLGYKLQVHHTAK